MARKVVIVGGGAGGIMASIAAAQSGADVTLLERNDKLGRKIYITGKGRCNVTNDCTQDEFLKEVPRNPRFLYSALNALNPQQLLMMLEDNGCPVVVQRGRRAYPASEKASDVTRTMEKIMRQAGVKVRLNCRVQEILVKDGVAAGVKLESGEDVAADAVILATGGFSYPGTGSTGDGHRMAQSLGHTVTDIRPSLVAVETAETWPSELQGLSLKNVTLTMKQGKKVLYTELGEMLFTHFGVSGPLVLTMSCHLPDPVTDCQVSLNLKPGLDAQQLDARLQREFDAQPRKMLRSILPSLLPARLAEMFPELCGVDGSKVCGQISRADRDKLTQTMQHLPLTVKALRPMTEAIITRGGVSVKEINPGTMESKKLPGLYFAGELMDVDAHTGGYNLQIAWSTGKLAGMSAAQEPQI